LRGRMGGGRNYHLENLSSLHSIKRGVSGVEMNLTGTSKRNLVDGEREVRRTGDFFRITSSDLFDTSEENRRRKGSQCCGVSSH